MLLLVFASLRLTTPCIPPVGRFFSPRIIEMIRDHDVFTVIAFLRGVSARHEHPARHEKEDDRLQLYYTVENGLNQVTISRGGPIKIELALATALRLLHTLEEEYKDEIR